MPAFDVAEELQALGIPETRAITYATQLDDEGFDSKPALLTLTEADLDSIGMRRGHKRLLLQYIASGGAISDPIRASTGKRPSRGTTDPVTSKRAKGSKSSMPKASASGGSSSSSRPTRGSSSSATTGSSSTTNSSSATASPSTTNSKPLAGCVFCVSGQMSVVRKVFWKILRDAGGGVSSSVTGSTTHLVTTVAEVANPTRKVMAAIQKGAFIVSEDFVSASINSGVKQDEAPYVLQSTAGKSPGTAVGSSSGASSSASSSTYNVAGSTGGSATMQLLTKHAQSKLNSKYAKYTANAPDPEHQDLARSVMLAKKLQLPIDSSQDDKVKGWWISEKLDGIRAYWSGTHLFSRNGNVILCPDWYRSALPKCALDMELWCGRRQFLRCSSIVRNRGSGSLWQYVSCRVFDAPLYPAQFEERYAYVKELLAPLADRYEAAKLAGQANGEDDDDDDDEDGDVKLVPHITHVGMVECKGAEHLNEQLDKMEKVGGEGLMLRQPGSMYEHKRSGTLLKVKSFFDEEALVVGHEKSSTGKYAGQCGALTLKTPDGRQFSCGSGMTNADRSKPPAIGTMVTFRYTELHNNGYPRFPVYVGERTDLDWDEYVESYEPPQAHQPKELKRDHTILYG